MFSDVHGYSRMMGRDEEATLRLLEELTDLMKPIIEDHRGSVLKYIGDAVLAVFESATDAVECAIEIQRRLGERNKAKPVPERVYIRIGIHVGDIVLKDNDVFGDGVNVAARIEPTALPGGICVSDAVFGMVGGEAGVQSESLGPHSLKNIREPVTIHRILTGAEEPGANALLSRLRLPARKAGNVAAAVVAVALAGFIGWRTLQSRQKHGAGPFTIVVAPFSATPEQAKDAARVQHDLIRQMLNEGLGGEPSVRIVAEGVKSAPRSYSESKRLGEKLDANLVIWGDVLLLNDELAITPHVTLVRPAPYARESDPKALHARLSRQTKLDLQEAKANELANVALLIVAEYFYDAGQSEKALLLLQRIHPSTYDSRYQEARIYYGNRRWPEMELAIAQASKLAPDDPNPPKLLGYSFFSRGDLPEAARVFESLLRRWPRDLDVLQTLGEVYAEQGNAPRAEKMLRRAIELDPKYSLAYINLANLYYKRGQFNQAADIFATLVKIQPGYIFGHLLYYICLKKSGNDKVAAAHLRGLVQSWPNDAESKWPEALVFYYAGRLRESTLVELMNQGEPDALSRRRCEGYFYLGMAKLLDGRLRDRDALARADLQKSLATGLANYFEYNLARFELDRLDGKRKP